MKVRSIKRVKHFKIIAKYVFPFRIFIIMCKAMLLLFIKRDWQIKEIKFLLEKHSIDRGLCRVI